MPTTHDVKLAALKSRQLLRDAFIDTKGYDVIWGKNQQPEVIDHWGDVKNDATFLDSNIKLVVNLADYYALVAAYRDSTNETVISPLKCSCKLSVDINAGDRITFTHEINDLVDEVKSFQVAKVEPQIHGVMVSKVVHLVPVRDN